MSLQELENSEASSDSIDLKVRPMTGALGAEIDGVDLGGSCDSVMVAAIHKALLEHQLLVFRSQRLSAAQLADFGRQFGELEHEPFIPKSEEDGVHVLKGFDKERITAQNLGWHVDHSYLEVPTKVIALHALDVPEAGNDTLFANLAQAYDDLADELKAFFSSLYAVHDVLQYGLNVGHYGVGTEGALGRLMGMRKMFAQVEHPLVCTHPETGRKSLYFNPAWATGIKGFSKKESEMVLSFLVQHTTQPHYQCRVRWENDMLALWDNRCIQHSPVPDYFGTRNMQRIAVKGDWRPH